MTNGSTAITAESVGMGNTSHIMLQKSGSDALISKDIFGSRIWSCRGKGCASRKEAGKPRDGMDSGGEEIGQFQAGWLQRFGRTYASMHLVFEGVWMDVPCKPLQAMPRTYGGRCGERVESAWSGYFIICRGPLLPLCGSSPPLSPPPPPATECSPAAWIA